MFLSQIPRAYREDIFGIASSLVVFHRGAGRPSAALPWPMCQQRPRPAAVALALPAPRLALKLFHEKVLACHLPRVCVHISAGGAAGCGGLDAQRGLLSVCCEVQLARPHVHTASNTINQVTGNSLISYWGKQPGKLSLHMQSWPRKFGHGSPLCGHQASMDRFSCFAVSNVSFIFIHNHFACQVQNGREVYSSYSLLPSWQE